ncbi:hypothetical protein NY2A_b877R [Paramecium bursaria Chlorella virus NY2A]|uniref:Uncharacterized protein b877R n=1 Tax=Paramecium bursaria Chlorella virus NY2A TaxID=46021 RepID=A7IY52_PBCVN|nr:hypothetical protein NY2A_b877R [Paramecium bursaria Chlorella virus NY2A]ABT15276.1 hypothetical protein NY2A_b877R [Paramecium bursaria Chlorella virus NY2A]
MISCTFPCESFIFFVFVEIIANTVDCSIERQICVMFLEISRGVTQTFEFFDDFVIFICNTCLSRRLRAVTLTVIM